MDATDELLTIAELAIGLILWLTVAVLMFTFLVFIGVEEQDTPP